MPWRFIIMDCIFCALAAKTIPADVVYENEEALAFLDVHPVAPGHTVVIPKTHSETILDTPEHVVRSVFLAVQAATRRLQESLRPDGFTIGMNHGAAGGQ